MIIRALFILFLVVGFQNCSSPLQTQDFSSLLTFKGNGGGYEGKPETYYRFISGYKCGDQDAPAQMTEIINGEAVIYDFKEGQCGGQGTPLAAGQISLSPLQNDFISVNDILFKRYDEKPKGIPQSLAEVLCRDNFADPQFEIVSHFDREQNKALTRVYTKDGNIDDFSVSRLLSINNVQYVSTQLSLNVDFSKTVGTEKRFEGFIEASTLSQIPKSKVTCIIGGSLDTSQIVVKPLVSDTALEPLVMANGDVLLTGKLANGIHDGLFKVSSNGKVENILEKQFGPNAYFQNKYEVSSKDRVIVILYHDDTGQTLAYLYNPLNSTFQQITNLKNAEFDETAVPDFQMIEEHHLMFKVMDKKNPFHQVLKHFDERTQEMRKVTETYQSMLFEHYMPNSQKVYINTLQYGMGEVPNWLYDIPTKTLTQLKISMPSNCYWYDKKAYVLENEKSMARTAICGKDQNNFELRMLRVSILDGTVTTIGINRQITWTALGSDWVVLGDKFRTNDAFADEQPRNPTLHNVISGQSWPIPFYPYFGYFNGQNYSTVGVDTTKFFNERRAQKIAAFEGYFYGFGGDVNNPTLFSMSTSTGESSKVCTSASGIKIYLNQLDNKKVYLMTYDYILSVFRFYIIKSPTSCERINEFPGTYYSFSNLVTVKDGFALGLGDTKTSSLAMANATEAYYIPGDGRPPVRLKNDFATLHSIKVSEDKKHLFFDGTSLQNMKRKINTLQIK